MSMIPFYGDGGRRLRPDETAAALCEKLDATVVDGFDEVVNLGGARCGGDRLCGYRESANHTAYLLPLSVISGITWRTQPLPSDASRPRVAFVLAIGFGNGSPLPQPSGQWDLYVNDRLALAIRVVNHSQLWQEGDCALAFTANRIETAPPFGSMTLSEMITDESFAAFGPAILTVPASWTEPGKPAEIRVEPTMPETSTRWFQVTPSSGSLWGADIYRAADLLSSAAPPRAGDWNVYFGDIHNHSAEMPDGSESGCGIGSRAGNYSYARGAGGLDFYALTEHDFQLAPCQYSEFLALADRYNDDGLFVCLPAFEHTNLFYGHRNIYFRDSGGVVVHSNRKDEPNQMELEQCRTPAELWQALEAADVKFFSLPHHTSATSHPFNWDLFHPEHDRLIEVYSSWGSSEYYGDFPRGVSDRYSELGVRDAIRRGCRFGLIASSDSHDGHPGNAQSPGVKHHHIYHPCGSGRVAVLAAELSRAAVFDALYERRCYATTGPPIVLDVTVNGQVMGSHGAVADTAPQLRIRCRGSNGLDHIRIMKNGDVALTIPCHGVWQWDMEWEDTEFDSGQVASYYARVVQVDRESAWSSPVWLGGR